MAKPRKSFVKTGVPEGITGKVGATEWNLSVPANTVVNVGYNFDFGSWYHKGIDEVVSACQQIIELWIRTHDGSYSDRTLRSCCDNGLNHFFEFLVTLSSALERELGLSDIQRETVEQFIQYLNQCEIATTTQYNRYTHVKIVLRGLCERGLLQRQRLFPKKPFPNTGRKKQSHAPLSSNERNQLSQALRKEIAEAFTRNESLTSYQLACCILAIALRSGRNTTPLLEMTTDCLRDHPLKENRKLLVVFKRRGGKSHLVSLRTTVQDLETVTTVMPDVVSIVESVTKLAAELRRELTESERNHLWIYKSRKRGEEGKIVPLSEPMIYHCAGKLVEKHKLKDLNGNPLQVNVSRMRATFINRLWKLSGNDPIITAKLGGHTLKVSNDHYLQATPEMQRDHKFMGDILVQELMSNTMGSHADNTPVGKCRDPLNGDRAPKNGQHCTDFLSCFRCRSCVITGDDLYRLFSFYWLIIKERNEIGPRHWGKVYSHIIRIIDRQIAPQFPREQVEAARQRAKNAPHPFWCNRELLEASA